MWFFIALSAVLGCQLWIYREKCEEYKFKTIRYRRISVKVIENATNKPQLLNLLGDELRDESNRSYSPRDLKRYRSCVAELLYHFNPDGLRE